MPYREKIAVCSEIHAKRANTVCSQKVEVFGVKASGKHGNHRAWKGNENCRYVEKGARVEI